MDAACTPCDTVDCVWLAPPGGPKQPAGNFPAPLRGWPASTPRWSLQTTSCHLHDACHPSPCHGSCPVRTEYHVPKHRGGGGGAGFVGRSRLWVCCGGRKVQIQVHSPQHRGMSQGSCSRAGRQASHSTGSCQQRLCPVPTTLRQRTLPCPDHSRSCPGQGGGPRRRTPRTRNPHMANTSQHQYGERRGPWAVGRGSRGWISARACSLAAASTCRRRKAVRDADGTHRDEWPGAN
jgi:hypothetical protein